MLERLKWWLYSRYVFLFVSKGPLSCRRIVHAMPPRSARSGEVKHD
jgi:hypothetical protein